MESEKKYKDKKLTFENEFLKFLIKSDTPGGSAATNLYYYKS